MKGNSSLRNILGNTAPASSAWHEDREEGARGEGAVDYVGDDIQDEASNQGKSKKKGKQKVTLFTLSSLS